MPGGFGAFGKMPALGDFFRIGIANSFVEAWDLWLQERLPAARAALGERWQDCYMSAPIWRFTLAGGLAGQTPMIGVMMASVDRVGRQFPLTLAGGLATETQVAAAHFLLADTFAALENLALDTLEDAATRESLADGLGELGPIPSPVPCAVSPVSAPGVIAASGPEGSAVVAGVAAHLLGQRLRAPSLWSAETDAGARLLVCEGLPSARQVADLLDIAAPVWSASAPLGEAVSQRLA